MSDEFQHTRTRLEIIRDGTIDKEAPQCEQPKDFKVGLNIYQRQSIYAMMNLENECCTFKDVYVIKTNFGVLCNETGSGKSFCILGLILLNKALELKETIVTVHCEQLMIMSKETNKKITKSNLFVIPISLIYTVWVPYISQFTNLNYCVLKSINDVMSIESYVSYDIVICTPKLYNVLIDVTYNSKIIWNRIIFDESDSIHLPNCKRPIAIFTWFVTSSIKNLMFPGGSFWKHENNNISRVLTDGIKNTGWIRNTFKSLEKC